MSAIDGDLGGQGQDRTADLRFFRPSLSQLSYLAKGEQVIIWVSGDDGIRTRDLRLDRPA